MQVLSKKNKILYDKFVRVAGGDARIVNAVLFGPGEPTVTITQVIEEIKKIRDDPSNPRHPQPSIIRLRKPIPTP